MSPEYRATYRKSQMLSGNARNNSPLRLTSLALSALSACLAICILGTAGDVLATYNRESKAMNPWWLPIWPGYFDIGGVRSLIGASVGIFLFNAMFTALCLVPKFKFNADSTRTMFTAITLSSSSSLLALITIIYNAVKNRSGRSGDSIQTWTCKFTDGIPAAPGIDDMETNKSFSRLCSESKFGFYGMVTILILQAILFFVAITQWAMSFWGKTKREFDDGRPDSGTEMESQKDLHFNEQFPKQNY